MGQRAELPLLVLLVDEHEENLQDEALIFVASAHLDHEEKDAEVVEAETLLDVLLREELF